MNMKIIILRNKVNGRLTSVTIDKKMDENYVLKRWNEGLETDQYEIHKIIEL